MGKETRIFLIVLIFLAIVLIATRLSGAINRPVTNGNFAATSFLSLQSIIVPYVYKMDIYLTRGDGSETQKFRKAEFGGKFKNNWGALIRKYDAYISTHITQDQTLLVATKALQERRRGILGDTSRYRLVSIDIGTSEEKLLLEGKLGEKIRCPQWSPDGASIAFWKGFLQDPEAGVFLLSVDSKNVRRVLRLQTFFDPCEDMDTYLRWIDDERLAVHSRREGVWIVDIQKDVVERIHDVENISAVPKEVVAALWGDMENLRSAPYWSPDRRFYFYHVVREGFLAKRWIERFDTQTGQRVSIVTIWWSPYRE